MFMVELAYEIKRYEDCLKYLTLLMKNSSNVNMKNIKMWSNCNKQIINKKRSAWLMILKKTNSDMNNDDKMIFDEYKLSISSDIKFTCNKVIQFIDDYLMDSVSDINHKILVYQICGDYHRYKAEVCVGKTMLNNYNEALHEYKSGWKLCLQNSVNTYIILYFAVKYAHCLESVHGHNRAILFIEEVLILTSQICDSEDGHLNIIIDRIIEYKQTLMQKLNNKLLISDEIIMSKDQLNSKTFNDLQIK